jgi:hypothetical protein
MYVCVYVCMYVCVCVDDIHIASMCCTRVSLHAWTHSCAYVQSADFASQYPDAFPRISFT